MKKYYFIICFISFICNSFAQDQLSIEKNKAQLKYTQLFPENRDTIISVFENEKTGEIYRVSKSYYGTKRSPDGYEYSVYKYGIIKPDGKKFGLRFNEEVVFIKNDTIYTYKPFFNIPGIDSINKGTGSITPDQDISKNQLTKYILTVNGLKILKSINTDINTIKCIDEVNTRFLVYCFYDGGNDFKILSSGFNLINRFVPFKNSGISVFNESRSGDKIILTCRPFGKMAADSFNICCYDIVKNSFTDNYFYYPGWEKTEAHCYGNIITFSLWKINNPNLKLFTYEISELKKIREYDLPISFLGCEIYPDRENDSIFYLVSKSYKNPNDPFLSEFNRKTGAVKTIYNLNDFFTGAEQNTKFTKEGMKTESFEPFLLKDFNALVFSELSDETKTDTHKNIVILLFNSKEKLKIDLPGNSYSFKIISKRNYFYLIQNNKIYKYETY